MSWSAHLQHTPDGLALCFREPVSRLDMTPDVAQHLASLIAIEARARMVGVVDTLMAENGSRAVVVRDDEHPLCCDCLECMNGLRGEP